MNKAQFTLVLLSSLCISACSSFDVGMLNPFSSDDEETSTVQVKPILDNQSLEPKVSEQELNDMYKEWKQTQPELIKLLTLAAEVQNLKLQLDMQAKELTKLKADTMDNITKKSFPSTNISPQVTYSVQIAAASSKRAAEQAWLSLLRKHNSFLKNHQPIFEKFSSNGRPFYSVRIANSPNNTQALNLCRQFKKLGGNCLIKKH